MLSSDYLIKGITGLSRASQGSPMEGHYGPAVIAHTISAVKMIWIKKRKRRSKNRSTSSFQNLNRSLYRYHQKIPNLVPYHILFKRWM